MGEREGKKVLAGKNLKKCGWTEDDLTEESLREEDLSEEGLDEESGNENPLTIEESFEELDNLLEMLEQSENSLEESFRYFERGMRLVRQCSAQIDKVEKQIFMLSAEENDV